MKQICIVLLIAPILAACTVSMPQVESIVATLNAASESDKLTSEDSQPIWLVSLGSSGSIVHPYADSGLVIFANEQGDAVAFDGWTVRSILGFGLGSSVKIKGKEGHREITYRGDIYSVFCHPWTWEPPKWRQSCENGHGEILLSEQGNIEVISMALGEPLGNLTMRLSTRELK